MVSLQGKIQIKKIIASYNYRAAQRNTNQFDSTLMDFDSLHKLSEKSKLHLFYFHLFPQTFAITVSLHAAAKQHTLPGQLSLIITYRLFFKRKCQKQNKTL